MPNSEFYGDNKYCDFFIFVRNMNMFSKLTNRIENNCKSPVKVNEYEIVGEFFDVPSFRMHKFEYLIRMPGHRFL